MPPPPLLAIVASVAVCVSIAAFRVRVLVLPALAICAAAVVVGSVAVGAASRTSPELSDGCRGWAVARARGRRRGAGDRRAVRRARSSGSSVPVLVFADPSTAPPIGAVVSLRADVELADAGDDVTYLLFARGDVAQDGDPPPLLAWAHGIRSSFLETSRTLPDPGGSLLPGLAIGDTSRVPEQLDAAMKAASLSHLTAVSGANCAIVVGACSRLPRCSGHRCPCDSRPPRGARRIRRARHSRAERAARRGDGGSRTRGRRPRVVRRSGCPCCAPPCSCCWSPTPGCHVPTVSRSRCWRRRAAAARRSARGRADPLVARRWLATVLSIPIAAQLACQPVILMLDPSLPVYGVPANLLAAPAAPVATVVGLLACLAAPGGPAARNRARLDRLASRGLDRRSRGAVRGASGSTRGLAVGVGRRRVARGYRGCAARCPARVGPFEASRSGGVRRHGGGLRGDRGGERRRHARRSTRRLAVRDVRRRAR